ncbi:MAG: hypothetical protein K2L02_00600 [Clostridia bacterium]|nr:hypothetical protein [Clostridia bacterium]
MTQLDVYYRAFKAYRKETADNSACEKERKKIIAANSDLDRLESTKYLCKINEDWVKAIEEGLEFVEKAVAEERQFIRTNGEVVPIEKVKKVSKDSVEHLAKHSEMITHVPEHEGDQLVPDKLYMVEKLSDYAVYENRFLYMMLVYIRDFIEFRLGKIETLRRTYFGKMKIDKEIVSGKSTLKIKTEIKEKRTDNPYPIPDKETEQLIKRIGDCREIINSLLNTDLMTQVAKSPMIKPPIVKTNVLKMNNNFKRSLALYDYIASYKGDGYSYEEVKFKFAPFSEAVANEIAESTRLTSFLVYKIGNGIEENLEAEYQVEEERRRIQEEKKLKERIARLKKKALESGQSLEEYMIALEDLVKRLEKDNETLERVRQEVEILNNRISALNEEQKELNRRIEALNQTIADKETEINELNQKYLGEISELNRVHREEINHLNTAHAEEVAKLKAEFSDKMSATVSEYEGKNSRLQSEINSMRETVDRTVKECEQKIAEDKAFVADFENIKKNIEKDCEAKVKAVKDELAFVRGELDGIRAQQGLLTPSHDYTSRERFKELEREYEAFHKFFTQQWEYTKKENRKNILKNSGKKGKGKKSK